MSTETNTPTAQPELYVFAISHFCEKGRWTLDHHGIDYRLRFTAPGPHFRLSKRLGVPESTYPVLVASGVAIQGSAEIVDWADANGSGPGLTPADDAFAAEARAIEQRLSDSIGVHTRRMFYSESLVEHPATVKPVFLMGLEGAAKWTFLGAWPVIRRVIISSMDLGPEQGRESRDIVDAELTWLEGILADGRRYLVGDSFTRADLSAAALVARLAAAAEHPLAGRFAMPPKLAELQESWRDRPALEWIRGLYREHRNRS